jgi:hypothetical protein
MFKVKCFHKFSLGLFIFISAAILTLTGCLKSDERDADTQLQPDTTRQVKTIPMTDSAVVQPKDSIPNLEGRWTGTFDNKSTTLQITSQDSLSFTGKITINYRDVINQQVKGSFNPKKKTFNMKDQLHSRFQGKYSGKLSDDTKKISGTFTMDLDGKKFPFSLTKR